MTQYTVVNASDSVGTLAVQAGIWEVKIVSVDIVGGIADGQWIDFLRYTGSFSGGTAISALLMRADGPPASATGRRGDVSFSGSEQLLDSVLFSAASFGPTGQLDGGNQSTWQTPLDLTIAPGTCFAIKRLINNNMSANIYFQELRLSQSY